MIENRDGSFGEILPMESVLKSLVENPELAKNAKAVHFGSPDELEQLKEIKNNLFCQEQSIAVLEKKVNQIMIYLGVDDKSEILIVQKGI